MSPQFLPLEKEMATHSSILAWKVPRMEEPGRHSPCGGKESNPTEQLHWFVIAFLPRSKRLLILWLQSPSAVILEPKKIKSLTVSTVCPSICREVTELEAMIFIF